MTQLDNSDTVRNKMKNSSLQSVAALWLAELCMWCGSLKVKEQTLDKS